MANTDNECKNLEVRDYYGNSTTHLHDILEHQNKMQKEVYGYQYDKMSLADLRSFWHMNEHAMVDEMHEAFDALGGIGDNHGSAIWKRWKKAHTNYKDMTIRDLTPNDLKELHMELVDMLHFFMNYAGSVGLDAKTMYNYYFAKAEENEQRQKRGY
jgi:hypothetical protein